MDALPSDRPDNSLPMYATISRETFDAIYPEWVQWVAGGRKHLPCAGGMRDQPEGLMDGLFYLDMLFEKMVAQLEEQKRKRQGKHG